MSVEFIEYPTRAAMVAALPEIRAEEGVTRIQVVDLGRTLEVHRLGDAPDDLLPDADAENAEDALSGPEEGSADAEPADGENAGESAHDGAEADEDADLLGVEADADAEDEADLEEIPDVSDADRATLRATVEEWGLEVTVPDAGPLQPIRDKVTAALAALVE